MTEEEIRRAAWKELIAGAESHAEDWIDEEGEYGDDSEKIYEAQFAILAELKAEHL